MYVCIANCKSNLFTCFLILRLELNLVNNHYYALLMFAELTENMPPHQSKLNSFSDKRGIELEDIIDILNFSYSPNFGNFLIHTGATANTQGLPSTIYHNKKQFFALCLRELKYNLVGLLQCIEHSLYGEVKARYWEFQLQNVPSFIRNPHSMPYQVPFL